MCPDLPRWTLEFSDRTEGETSMPQIDVGELQRALRGVGLLPPEGIDPQKTEVGTSGTLLADNALQVTALAKKSVNRGGGVGAAGAVLAAAWGWLQDNPLALTVAIIGASIIAAAWGLGVAWVTQSDTRARSAVSTETMRARGVVTAAMIRAAAEGAGDHDAQSIGLAAADVLMAIGQGHHVVITTDAGKSGELSELTWQDGAPVRVTIPNDVCDVDKVKKITVRP